MKKIILAVIFLLTTMVVTVSAEQVKRNVRVTEMNGVAEMKSGKSKWTTAALGAVLQEGDFIRTKDNSSVVLKLEGEVETAIVEVRPNSQLLIAELNEDKLAATQNTLLDLALGKVLITAQKLHAEKSKFEVKTPTSIVGVRGTTFEVSVEQVE